MTPAQKRDREDWELANEIMAATSALMKLVNKARERGLYVSGCMIHHPFDVIRITVRRDFKHKTKNICDAEIGT